MYFNEEVAQILQEYIEIERPKYVPFTEEKALFLSTQFIHKKNEIIIYLRI